MMTYESAGEGEILKSLRPGAPLANTVFAILDPAGRALTPPARGPGRLFRDSADMSEKMNSIAAHFNSNSAVVPNDIPAVDTVPLAINVAACDKLPLVLVVGRTEEEKRILASRLTPLAWSDQFIGKLIYAKASEADPRLIRGTAGGSGYIFASPNQFGTEATTTVQLGASASSEQLSQAMQTAINAYRPQYSSNREHVGLGHRNGLSWDTPLPVTDPKSIEVRESRRMYGRGFR